MTQILNLTQHLATPEQIAAGVIDLPVDFHDRVRGILTFEHLPTAREMTQRAETLTDLVVDFQVMYPSITTVMIGGAPFFMAPLEAALVQRGLQPVYAFSTRESVEESQPDGSVRKVNVFRHAGFVTPTAIHREESI